MPNEYKSELSPSKDIVERLRDYDENDLVSIEVMNEAADEIERLRGQLKMSEQRFATLKEAYDKNRRRNIQLYGSNKIDGAGVPWSPKKLTEPEALGEKE
jgi:vancomycin resistance protein YoaR